MKFHQMTRAIKRALEKGAAPSQEVLQAALDDLVEMDYRIGKVAHLLELHARFYERRVFKPTCLCRWVKDRDKATLVTAAKEYERQAATFMQFSGCLINGLDLPFSDDYRQRTAAMAAAVKQYEEAPDEKG